METFELKKISGDADFQKAIMEAMPCRLAHDGEVVATVHPISENGQPFRILCLDGGGAKGFYSLGFLRELERICGKKLCDFFDAIYGTSTGAIIAALLGLGYSVDEIHTRYKSCIPRILNPKMGICQFGESQKAAARSQALAKCCDEYFEKKKFQEFKTFVALVATNWDKATPLVFKSSVSAAHGMKSTFLPGFGATISEAVQASCSATPFFKSKQIVLENQGTVEARDGGFSANNPSLFAMIDALGPRAIMPAQIRLLSLGVGKYPEPRGSLKERVIKSLEHVKILSKTLDVNSETTEIIVKLLFPHVKHVRVSEPFTTPELATNLLEHCLKKLDKLSQRGRDSFGKREKEIKTLFDLS